jgi:nucleoside-diphosphate-sugar epimerase
MSTRASTATAEIGPHNSIFSGASRVILRLPSAILSFRIILPFGAFLAAILQETFMRHLVTGGSGFLGNLIAQRLLAEGEQVRVLDVWEDPARPPAIEFVRCDVRDAAGVAKALEGVDIVHHNAALVPLTKSGKDFATVNLDGSRIVAEQAAGRVRAFIHMSSSAVYGCPDDEPITAKTPCKPVEIYGRSKLAGELAVREACDTRNTPLVVIRPRTILGTGRLGIFQLLFDWISQGQNVFVIGGGNGKFQFIHADDLIDAYMLAVRVEKPGIYNVGAADYGTLREALENLIRYAGTASRVKSLPAGLTITGLRTLDLLGLSPLAPWHYLTYHKPFHFDVAPLLALGWKPKYSNDAMFRASYDWFLANREAARQESGGSPHRKRVREGLLWVLRKFA